MAIRIWAVIVAAIGWYMVGRGLARLAKRDKGGKVKIPARYQDKDGDMEWKIGEESPQVSQLLLLPALLAIGATLVTMIPWTWLVIVLLAILSLAIFFFLMVDMDSDMLYYREKKRVDAGDGTANITYEISSPGMPFKKTALVCLALGVFWGVVAWLVGKAVAGQWAVMGIVLAGFAIMLVVMQQLGKIEKRKRENYSRDYCPRCGHQLKRKQTYGPVQTTHMGGDRYAVENGIKITETCPLCGFEKVL